MNEDSAMKISNELQQIKQFIKTLSEGYKKILENTTVIKNDMDALGNLVYNVFIQLGVVEKPDSLQKKTNGKTTSVKGKDKKRTRQADLVETTDNK